MEPKMLANPSMDFTNLLEGDLKEEVMKELKKDPEAQTANSPESKLSRISTEASVGEVTKSVNSFQYEAQNLDVPVVVVTSEIHPWSKSGGLAIVAAQYAYNFAIRGHRTMAIAPMYDNYDGAFYQCTKSFELFGGLHEVHRIRIAAMKIARSANYRGDGGEYSDNLFRFALFSLAALEVPVAIELGGAPCYGGRVMFIANDWQTGLLPVYMVHRHRAFGNYNHARCMYVIHNLGYQGCYPLRLGLPGTLQYDNFAQLGLPFAALGDLLYQYPLHERTFEGETLNLTKGAIQCCDRIVTVSPTYADEIRTLEGGFRLHDFVATKSYFLVGILNGIDASWAPEKDKTIAETFSAEDLSGKRLCKRHLQRKLGLKEDDDACILSFVGRLTSQKGIDLIGSCVHWIMEVQLVMMGNGEEDFGEGLTADEGPNVTAKLAEPNEHRDCNHTPSLRTERKECASVCCAAPEALAIGHMLRWAETTWKVGTQNLTLPQDFSWSRAIDDYERHFDWTIAVRHAVLCGTVYSSASFALDDEFFYFFYIASPFAASRSKSCLQQVLMVLHLHLQQVPRGSTVLGKALSVVFSPSASHRVAFDRRRQTQSRDDAPHGWPT
ncbi:unnamed protein product [Durusdinium trenchii]|uniref:Starch synthase catalytic domain-containing protein n=1 Tax=Durusdinium trenchii TaxID=1381693 RepID=A0ABP0KG85_9DINO